MNNSVFLIFYKIYNDNLMFHTKRYMDSTWKMNELISNTQQTFMHLMQLFFVKREGGIELLLLLKILGYKKI